MFKSTDFFGSNKFVSKNTNSIKNQNLYDEIQFELDQEIDDAKQVDEKLVQPNFNKIGRSI
jgi:hypothetical protein